MTRIPFPVVTRARGQAEQQPALRKACQDFETIFVGLLLKGMRKTVPESGLLESSEQGYFREMLDEEYAKSISKSGKLGIADALYRQMTAKSAPVRPTDGTVALKQSNQPVDKRR